MSYLAYLIPGTVFVWLAVKLSGAMRSVMNSKATSFVAGGLMTFSFLQPVNAQNITPRDSTSSNLRVELQVLDDYVKTIPVSNAFVELYKNNEKLLDGYTDDDGKIILKDTTNTVNVNVNVNVPVVSSPFPNPTSGVFNTYFNISESGRVTLGVHDVHGRPVLKKEKNLSSGDYDLRTDISGFPSGFYVQTITQGSNINFSKIIKQGDNGGVPGFNLSLNEFNNEQSINPRSLNDYLISINRADYDAKTFNLDVEQDSVITKYLSRNNVLNVLTKDLDGASKVADFLFNNKRITTPHTSTEKSGVYSFESGDDHVFPFSLEIPSKDINLSLEEKEVSFVYPNNEYVKDLETKVDEENTTISSPFFTHVLADSLNKSYFFSVTDSRFEPKDTLVNLAQNPRIVLTEKIIFNDLSTEWDLAEQPTLTLNLNELVNFYTGKDTVWVTSNDVQVNNNELIPFQTNYSQEVKFKVHAVAEGGTTKQQEYSLNKLPFKPRTKIIMHESDTNSVQPGVLIIGNDSIPAPTGVITAHTPFLGDSIQTRLVNPHDDDVYWSFIRTTPLSYADPESDTLKTYMVDFYLRDINKVITDSLYVKGHSPLSDSTKMAPERFARFIKFAHFEATRNPVTLGNTGFKPSDYENINYYSNTLNRWTQSENGMYPDTINIYRTSLTRFEYDEDGNVINYKTDTMEQKTIDRIINSLNTWIFPLLEYEIPVAVLDTLILNHKPHRHGSTIENHNKIYIRPRSDLREQTGADAIMSVEANPTAVVYCFITFQTNPELGSTEAYLKGLANHEFVSALSYNSMARVRANNAHARRSESALATPLVSASYDPTSYDMKMGRLIRNTGFKPREKWEYIFKLTEAELSDPQVLN